MKKLLIGLIALSSLSAFADIDKVPSLKEILAKQTCTVSVVNRPIDFDKGINFINIGRLYMQAKLRSGFGEVLPSSNTVRRLAVGRSMNIAGIEKGMNRVLLKDKSIYSFCIDYVDGNDDCEDPGQLTLAQIEEYSDFNLKVSCSKDNVVLF